jgi:hypothetical protein
VTGVVDELAPVTDEQWAFLRSRLLGRYEATWSDGKRLVLHARCWSDADALARQLEAPAGVTVRSVEALTS